MGRGRGKSTKGALRGASTPRGRRGRAKKISRIVSSDEDNSNETSSRDEKTEIQETENQETFISSNNNEQQQEPTNLAAGADPTVLPTSKEVEMVEEKEFEEQQPYKCEYFYKI